MPALSPAAEAASGAGWKGAAAPREIRDGDAPWIETEEVPACPVCGGTRGSTHAVAFDYELRTCGNPWRFVRCDDCGHVRLHPRPAVSALPVIYPPSYYAYNYEQEIHPLAVRAKAWLDRRKLRTILAALPRPPRSYLDVGCGNGRFLRQMHALGVPRERVHGLELDAGVVAPLAEEGFRVHAERVETCDAIRDGSLDLVTMFHVIEHVAEPGAVVERIARWLAPGGVLALETPNLASLDARLFGRRYWGGYHVPRHWHLFTPDTLERLLAERGLEPVATRWETGHSFWMYSVHHWLRYHGRPMPRLARHFDPFRGLPLLAAFTAFDRARGALGVPTSAMLVLARKPG